jgi:hypothetical protein
MAKKMNFDFKQFMLHKGEIVGLSVAAGFAALMLVTGVLGGMGSKSPKDALETGAKEVDQSVARASYSDPDVLTKLPNGKLEPPVFVRDRDPRSTELDEWVTRDNPEDTKKRNPEVKVPGEYQVDVLHVPVREIDYRKGGILYSVGGGADGQNVDPAEKVRPTHMVVVSAVFPYKDQLEAFRWALRLKKQDRLEQFPKFRGFYVYRRDILPNGKAKKFKTPQGKDTEWALLDVSDDNEVKKESKKFQAWDAVVQKSSFRMMMAASPERARWDPNLRQVAFTGLVMPLPALHGDQGYPPVKLKGLPEPKEEKDEPEDTPDKERRPAFPPGPMGLKPGGGNGPGDGRGGDPFGKKGGGGRDGGGGGSLTQVKWDKLPEDMRKRLSGLSIDVFDPEGELSIDPGAGDDPEKSNTGDRTEPPKGGGGDDLRSRQQQMMDQMRKMSGSKIRGVGFGRYGGGGYTPFNPSTPPKKDEKVEPVDLEKATHTLFRLVDVDVEPGHTYEYLITIRMANPNYKKDKEVASLKYAKLDELWSAPKYIAPVHVPYPVKLYAVDERLINPDWNLTNARTVAKTTLVGAVTAAAGKEKVAFQVHRWFDRVRQPGFEAIRLGDWLVAERVLAYRGEYLRWDIETQVPKWDAAEKAFKIATTAPKRGTKPIPHIPVTFTTETESNLLPAILVDFQGGLQEQNFAQGKASRYVTDSSGVEVLILSPDGELTVRYGREDSDPDTAVGKERKDRYEAFKKRLKKLKEVEEPMKKDNKNPFGDGRKGGKGS